MNQTVNQYLPICVKPTVSSSNVNDCLGKTNYNEPESEKWAHN